MSYRSIDLQASVPRTAEIAPIQQHMQHRSSAEQMMLAQETIKQMEHNAQRKTKTEETSNGTISDRDPREKHHERRQGKRNGGERESEAPEGNIHPYKGKHIDLSL